MMESTVTHCCKALCVEPAATWAPGSNDEMRMSKICPAVAAPLSVTIASSLVVVILFAPNTLSQSGSLKAEISAVDLARKVSATN